MRRPSEKPSAAEISAHEEEVAKFLADAFEPDEKPNVKALPTRDQLSLALGRTYMAIQGIGRSEGIESEEFLACAGSLAWLVQAIYRQLAIENGSATA